MWLQREFHSLLGGDGSSGLVLLVLPGIWETRNNSSNSLGRSSLASCNISRAPNTEFGRLTRNHNKQFHKVVIDRRRTRRLEDEDIFISNRRMDLNGSLE
jgi:hypothetical protein